jgi:DNA-binding response OmpR family regulator
VAPRILMIEDDERLATMVSEYLATSGLQVTVAPRADRGLSLLAKGGFQAVLLDVMLPDADGFEVCRRIRAGSDVPVLMLTARGDDTDRIVGLELGADDYVVKPFSPKELVARVRALFRRLERKDEGEVLLTFDRLEVDRPRHTVTWDGQPVRLTAKEFALLVALLEAGGRVLSRQALLENVWGYSYAEGTRTVDVHVRRLREKLPELARSIVTVKSLGYRLAHEEEP